jgi:hypothetical protein
LTAEKRYKGTFNNSMEKIVSDLKKLVPFKDTVEIGDIGFDCRQETTNVGLRPGKRYST